MIEENGGGWGRPGSRKVLYPTLGANGVFFWILGRQWRILLAMPAWLITVAETPLFVSQAERVWSDAEREEFVDFIAGNPEAGDLIPETGGVRKVRWSRAGSGKRGGVRVIYFYHDANRPLYLLLVYAKATREDLSADEKRTVRKLAAVLKGKGRQKRASEHRK